MLGSRGPDSSDGNGAPQVKLWERLRDAMVRPSNSDKASTAAAPVESLSVEELEAASKSADDKERLVGFVAAPFAAAIGLLVITALVDHDPSALLADGQPNKLHVSVSLYHELLLVLMGMSVLMLAMAYWRKRLYLGIVMALYGLAIFNLHYWGFGIPFVLSSAWLLVRSYRLQQRLKLATSDGGRARDGSGAKTNGSRPQSSRRYTPPIARTGHSPRPKPKGEQKAG